MRVVEIYAQGGFPLLVVESKKDFATKYGLQAEYWHYFDTAESPEVQGLISESASLRQAIASLRDDLDQVAARAEEGVNRISSLEKRVAKISDATEAVGAAKLRRRLEEAHQRIDTLDARIAAVTAAARANTQERERAATLQAPASSGTAGGSWPADSLPR